MLQYHADLRAKRILQFISLTLFAAIAAVVLSVWEMSAAEIISLLGGLLFLWSLLGLFYIPLSLERLCLTLTDSSLALESGVFLMKRRQLLLRSVQLVSLMQIPFVHFCFLTIHAYGGILVLPFLCPEDARALHTFLTKRMTDRMEGRHVS